MNNWTDQEPIARRARLNELAAQGYDTLTEEEKDEHNLLAGLVAKDEEGADNGEG